MCQGIHINYNARSMKCGTKPFLLRSVFFQILIIFVSVIGYLSLDLESLNTKKWFEIYFLFVILQSYYIHYKIQDDWKNISNLFLFFFLFFLGSRFIFDLFSNQYDVCYFEFFLGRYVDVDIVNRSLLNLILAVCGYNIGAICYNIYNDRRYKYIDYLHLDSIVSKREIYVLLAIGVSFKLYYSYQVFQAMLTYGYLQLFLEGYEIDRNLLMMFLESFYEIAVFLIISKNGRLNMIEIGLVVFYTVLSLATGQRGFAMLSVVFILFYSYKLRRVKLKLSSIILIGLLLVSISEVVSAIRGGKEMDIVSMADTMLGFFYGQAISITVLVATIDYDKYIDFSFLDLFGHIRYLLDYYWNILALQSFSHVDNLALQANVYKWYGQYISCLTNPRMFYNGYGLGSSYVGQMYAVGKETMQVLGGVFVGFLVEFIYSALHSSHLLKRFWAFHALTIVIFLPRANLFEFISMQWHVYIVSALLYLYMRVKSSSTYTAKSHV